MAQKRLMQPTPLDEIRMKVLTYHQKMNKIAEFLKKHKAPSNIQIDPAKEYLEFYIEKDSLIRLNTIALLPKFDCFAVYLGLANDNDSVTGCFLGVDKNKRILAAHRTGKAGKNSSQSIAGEDTWLPPGKGKRGTYKKHANDFTLETKRSRIAKHIS